MYFQLQGRLFEQLQRAAIRPPISPIVANLYMKDFEIKATNTDEHPPRMYVDEIFLVIVTSRKISSFNISTVQTHTSISEQKKQEAMGPLLSWILW